MATPGRERHHDDVTAILSRGRHAFAADPPISPTLDRRCERRSLGEPGTKVAATR